MSRRHSHGVEKPSSPRSKAAVLRAFPSVVDLTTYDVPDDMAGTFKFDCPIKYVFHSHGIIIESEEVDDDDDDSAAYSITILAPAMLFKRTNGIKPQQVKIDVCVSDGKLYKGNLVDWDFHYNLAVITIKSKSHVQPATLRALDDVSSIDIDAYENSQSHDGNSFQLHRHSNLLKVQTGTKIMILCTSCFLPFSSGAACGIFRSIYPNSDDCKELYWVDCAGIEGIHSGAVINLSGEVLGIVLSESGFLPSNFISRWWNHYKIKGFYIMKLHLLKPFILLQYVVQWFLDHRFCPYPSQKYPYCLSESTPFLFPMDPSLAVSDRALKDSDGEKRWMNLSIQGESCVTIGYVKFCRPWVGVRITNLAEAQLMFLGQFRNTFSETGAGVIVTKVEQDTPAYRAGIMIKDVIVKCDGKQIRSKMEFFESMWDNTGKSVVLKVLRTSEGKELDLRLSIGKTAKTNFYGWKLPTISTEDP